MFGSKDFQYPWAMAYISPTDLRRHATCVPFCVLITFRTLATDPNGTRFVFFHWTTNLFEFPIKFYISMHPFWAVASYINRKEKEKKKYLNKIVKRARICICAVGANLSVVFGWRGAGWQKVSYALGYGRYNFFMDLRLLFTRRWK